MDPQPVIPLGYAKERPSPFWERAGRWLVPGSWVVGLVGWGLIEYETESVLLSAPVLFTTGVLLIIGGALNHARSSIVLGVIHCGICLLFVALVNLRNWSPTEAHEPFLIMGAMYLIVSGAITAAVLFGRPFRSTAESDMVKPS